MKKIYVLDENNNLQLIDAGATQYSELTDTPIKINTLDTTVASDGTLTPSVGHAWTEEEVMYFCAAADDGRYDLLTAEQGHELLLVDSTNQLLGRRYRRINTDYDVVWDAETSQWITISDTTAKQLIYKFLNESEIPSTVVVGDPFIIQLYYYSNVGTGRVTVTMNGIAFTVGTVASGQQINIDLTSRIVDGSNTISIKIANDATQAFVPEIAVTGINLTYTPDFDQYHAFTGDIIFNYTCSGSSNKVIHFDITNAEGEVSTYEVSHGSGYYGAYANLSASYFSKGENSIDTYMYAVDEHGAEVTRTITTSYKVPFLTDDEPLLMVYYDNWDNLKQYGSISIPYYIWSRSAGNADKIKFSIQSEAITGGSLDYEYTVADSGALVNYLQYNTRHQWLISSLPTTFVGTEDKQATFQIYGTYNTSYLTNIFTRSGVSISSSSSAMQTVEGYMFNFAATDLIRPIATWTSTGTSPKQMELNDFNWNTDGISSDESGNSCLKFSPAASAVMDELVNPLFGSYNQRFTMELNFRVSANASEQPIIKYYDKHAANPDLYGLFIYPNKAIFKYQGGTSEINYFAGERTHLAYVICNKTVTDANPATPDQPQSAELLYLFVYVNGILSQMKAINSSTEFPRSCGTIEFNTNQNNFDLYSFRGYAFSLTSAQVLQNYVSEFGNATSKESIYLKNNVYSETVETGMPGEYEVSFDKVKGKIPCYVMVAETLPDTKSYLPGRGIFYEADSNGRLTQWKDGKSMATTYYYTRSYNYIEDPNGQYIKVNGSYIIPSSYEPGVTRYSRNGFTNWIRNKAIKFCGQGTSSLAYPRKNFKLKHKDKFYIKGHTSGKEKNFTFKADYMDSSGANNIGNAQVLDDSIVRSRWIGTPVATNPNLRVNLDGFPIAMFWCPAKSNMTEGVEQDPQAENVYDSDKTTQLFDSVIPNADNELIGEVIPKDPQYIGTFNFNYDKKAKALLGWDEDIFQGFEFRGNSSNCDLFKGFENMCALTSTSEGFEWRWTCISDWIDDYHDGNLALTIDGGYFDEDVAQKYSEADYLADGGDSIVDLVPFNYFYVKKDNVDCQLMHKVVDPETSAVSYEPINYISINPNNSAWDITSCEGISKLSNNICLEYGVKFATKDGVDSFCYQLPYHVSAEKPLGESYPDGSHYYAFSFNPEHEFKFEYNDTQEYFTDVDNWTALYPADEVFAKKVTYGQDSDGDYYLDNSVVDDGKYHLIANYPADEQAAILADVENRYNQIVEYVSVSTDDYIYTWDYMREIFKNWAYVIEAVAHATNDNYRAILDSNNTYGQNGNGLFCYDALLNYYCSSLITGLCDNYAKNMFMHSYDGGRTWSPAWYDMDTCYGLNNEGAYTKLYDIDFMDLDTTGARAFNGSNSRLWELLYNNAMSDIRSMYQYLRANNYISYDKIMAVVYGENIAFKSESLYNANAVYRYMEPLAWHSNTKPEAAQGNRLQLLKYWNTKRQTFLDSRYEGNGWTTDTIVLRLNNTEPVTFELIPDTNMFLGANFNSGQATVPSIKSPTKILANNMWTCSYGPSTNLNTYIYGASHLLEVGDLSICNSTEYSIATAVNLRKLKIGDEVHPPIVHTRLNLSSSNPYTNLKEIDLTNVFFSDTTSLNFRTSSDINLMPALETLKLKGSNIEYLTLVDYTPIKNLSYSSAIRNVNLINLIFLNNLTFEGIDNVESLTIQNCPELDTISILQRFQGKIMNVTADHLTNTEDTAATQAFMNWLMSVNANLEGDIWVEALDDEPGGILDQYRAKWPKLTITMKQIYEDEVIFGTTGEGDR